MSNEDRVQRGELLVQKEEAVNEHGALREQLGRYAAVCETTKKALEQLLTDRIHPSCFEKLDDGVLVIPSKSRSEMGKTVKPKQLGGIVETVVKLRDNIHTLERLDRELGHQ